MPKVKYTSNKADHDGTTRIILEGSSDDPKRYVDLGEEIELTDQELESLRKRHNFSEQGSGGQQQQGKSQEQTDRTSEGSGSKQAGASGEKKS